MMGEWEPTEQLGIKGKEMENKIVGHIINRLHGLVYPEQPGEPAPIYPVFPFKAIVLGKPFTGKTTALKQLADG